MPSVFVSTCGFAAPPSAASAQGHTAPGLAPNHSVVAVGTTPSASSASCSTRPTVTMRFGSAVMFVAPYLCGSATGKPVAPAAAPTSPLPAGSGFGPQAPRKRMSPAAATVAVRRIVFSRTADPFDYGALVDDPGRECRLALPNHTTGMDGAR